MSIGKQEASTWMGIEYDNTRDDTLSVFFSCGSVNKLEGSGSSDLDAIGVGWVG